MPTIKTELTIGAVVSCITLTLLLIGGAWFIFPLRDLPENQKAVSTEIHHIQRTLAVQTEALKTLAEITREARDLRRDLDRHEGVLHLHHNRLQNLERRPYSHNAPSPE